MKDLLIDRLRAKRAVIGIIGLGYVGLPLVLRYSQVGYKVIGFDIDAAKARKLAAGQSYIEHISAEDIARANATGFEATTDFARVGEVDAIILCVPTPLNKYREPDLSFVTQTVDSIVPHLREGQLVSLESTTYPGTTEEELRPRIERSGFRVGETAFLVYSPEREDPGNLNFTTRTIPKVVGGSTAACLEAGLALYDSVIDTVVPVSSTKVAELTKLLENTFRHVNIALVNELAQLCDRLGIDVWEVIDAASTKPFGFMRFDPGPGMGGHCLPVDPFYLAFKARQHDFYPEFIVLAGKVNLAQPAFCVERIERALHQAGKPVNGSRILVLGASYKGGIGDTRESPALKIIGRLQDLGADVAYHDAHVPELRGHGLASVDLEEGLASADLAAIVTAHPDVDYERVAAVAPLVLDFRGVTRGFAADNVERL